MNLVQIEYSIWGKKPFEGYCTRVVFNPLGREGFLLLENENEGTEVYIALSKILNIAVMKVPEEERKAKEDKCCDTCVYSELRIGQEPCYSCDANYSHYKPREEAPIPVRICPECKHWAKSRSVYPCNDCKDDRNLYEPKER